MISRSNERGKWCEVRSIGSSVVDHSHLRNFQSVPANLLWDPKTKFSTHILVEKFICVASLKRSWGPSPQGCHQLRWKEVCVDLTCFDWKTWLWKPFNQWLLCQDVRLHLTPCPKGRVAKKRHKIERFKRWKCCIKGYSPGIDCNDMVWMQF